MKKIGSLCVSVLMLFSCSKSEESYTVSQKSLVEAVYSSLTIEPQTKYIVQSAINGYVDSVFVKEGDSVSPANLLFQLRDENILATISNAELSYDLASNYFQGNNNQLKDARLEMQTARTKYQTDSLNFTRFQKLNAKGVSSEAEFENARLLMESSKTQYQNSINRIKRLEKELEVKMLQAKNNANSVQDRMKDLFVHSQIRGQVYQVFKDAGEFVTMKEPLAIIGSGDDFVLQLRIDEVDVMKVKKGQPMAVTLESFPGRTFEAEVTRIYPKMEEQTQTFIVEGKFTKAPERLFYGLTGEANIIIKMVKGALVIPLDYVNDQDEVRTESGMKKVILGIRSLSAVEVRSGLKVGDVLLKPEP